MSYNEDEEKLRQKIADFSETNPEDWFFTYRARYGIQTVLKLIHGEVITQPMTCIVAVNPILNSENQPTYGEVSPQSLSLDYTKLPLSDKTKAIIIQHTYGIMQELSSFRALADEKNILLIEDSAHGLGRLARDKEGQPFADISIHSFGIEKGVSSRFGGAVWLNPQMKNQELYQSCKKALNNLPYLSAYTSSVARTFRPVNRLLYQFPLATNIKLRHLLTQLHLFEPAIAMSEQKAQPFHQASKPSGWMLQEMLNVIPELKENYSQRERIVALYLEELSDYLEEIEIGISPLLKFPVLFPTKAAAEIAQKTLEKEDIYAVRWYYPMFFPGIGDNSIYQYDSETCPIAENLSERILCLPTTITQEEAQKAIQTIKDMRKS